MFGRMPPMSRLRHALSSAMHTDAIAAMPDRFAALITALENIDVHPDYRTDIHNILDTAVKLGNALVDETYPEAMALFHISSMMNLLPRLLSHISTRPTTTGYAIMMPRNGSIYPQVHSTEAEALKHLEQLRAIGAGRDARVVPVQVTSTHVVRPTVPKAPPPPLVQEPPSVERPSWDVLNLPPPPAPVMLAPHDLEAEMDRLEREAEQLPLPLATGALSEKPPGEATGGRLDPDGLPPLDDSESPPRASPGAGNSNPPAPPA